MNDTKQVAAESAVETTTQTSSPQVEEPKVTEVQTQQTQQNVEPELPVDEAERRRAFQEQRLKIKELEETTERLKSEQEARVRNESAFDSFRAPTQPVGQVDINQFTNQLTGEVNWNAYNAAINANASQVAQHQASQTVREQLDEYQARSKYPEVFADKKTEKQIAALYLFEKLNGRDVSIEQLAGEVARGTNKILEKAAQAGAEQALTELSPKEQASLAVTGTTSASARQAQTIAEEDSMRQTIRRGGKTAEDALAKALSGRK